MATVENMQEINMVGDEMHRTVDVTPSLSDSCRTTSLEFGKNIQLHLPFFSFPKGL